MIYISLSLQIGSEVRPDLPEIKKSLILWILGIIAISNGLWSPGAGIMRINEGAKFLIKTHRYQKILIYVR